MLSTRLGRRGFIQLMASVAAAGGLSYAGVPVAEKILAAEPVRGEVIERLVHADDPLAYFQTTNPVGPKIAIVNAAIETRQPLSEFPDWDFTGGIGEFLRNEQRRNPQYETMLDIVFPTTLRSPDTPFRNNFDIVHKVFFSGERFDYVLQFGNCCIAFPDSCVTQFSAEYSIGDKSPIISVNLHSSSELLFTEVNRA